MREAIVHLSDNDLADIGFRKLVSHCRRAGIRTVELLEDEGTRCVPQIEVNNRLSEDKLESMECVHSWELVSEREDSYIYVLEISALDLPAEMAKEHDNLVGMCDPTVNDRGLLLSLVGSQETIREVLRNFQEAGVNPKLEKFGEYMNDQRKHGTLTERQYEVLKAAFEKGFYEVPKQASVDDIADDVGLEGATVSEHLQRAERNLLSQQFSMSS